VMGKDTLDTSLLSQIVKKGVLQIAFVTARDAITGPGVSVLFSSCILAYLFMVTLQSHLLSFRYSVCRMFAAALAAIGELPLLRHKSFYYGLLFLGGVASFVNLSCNFFSDPGSLHTSIGLPLMAYLKTRR